MVHLKQKGHNISIKGFVIHKINKDAGDRKTTVKLASKLIVPTAKEKRFIAVVSDAYYKKSGPIYGVFEEDIRQEVFQNQMKCYSNDEIDFLSFSQKMMIWYEKVIKDVVPATGGFAIFANYVNTDTNNNFMLVLTLNNKDGYYFNEDKLTLEDIKSLDMSKIDVGCQINITRWLSVNEGNPEYVTYLSFVKGIKNVSYYSNSLLGCANKTTNTASTLRFKNALDQFCKFKKYNSEKEIEIKNKVYSFCKDCMANKGAIYLKLISGLIADSEENQDEFMEFAAGEDYQVDSIISPDPSKIKLIGWVKYKGEALNISFSNSLLDREIFYDPVAKQLTIKNIPDQLASQIPYCE